MTELEDERVDSSDSGRWWAGFSFSGDNGGRLVAEAAGVGVGKVDAGEVVADVSNVAAGFVPLDGLGGVRIYLVGLGFQVRPLD